MKRFLAVILLVACVATSFAQAKGGKNLSRFDSRKYHFGFALAGNQSSFFLTRTANFSFNDSILGIDLKPQAGFNLSIIASFNPIKNINLRFAPGLAFQDRTLSYRLLRSNGTVNVQDKPISSVWLEIPLIVKFRTDRSGNMDAYGIFGAKYARDMQSQKDVSLTSSTLVKIKNTDYCIEAGGGLDFYLPYFKLALEFKTSIGLRNLLINDNTIYSNAISQLRSRSFVFSITFEG